MFSVTECKYHAPCGLCTYYNKQCKDVCGKNKNRRCPSKSKIKDTNENIDPVLKDIIDGKGLRNLTDKDLHLDENNLPNGICKSY